MTSSSENGIKLFLLSPTLTLYSTTAAVWLRWFGCNATNPVSRWELGKEEVRFENSNKYIHGDGRGSWRCSFLAIWCCQWVGSNVTHLFIFWIPPSSRLLGLKPYLFYELLKSPSVFMTFWFYQQVLSLLSHLVNGFIILLIFYSVSHSWTFTTIRYGYKQFFNLDTCFVALAIVSSLFYLPVEAAPRALRKISLDLVLHYFQKRNEKGSGDIGTVWLHFSWIPPQSQNKCYNIQLPAITLHPES